MKIINSLLVLFFIVITSGISFAQDVSQIEWLGDLDGKSAATYSDAVKMFSFQTTGKASSFAIDSAMIGKNGIALDGYAENKTLSKGMLAKMTARYLGLGGSLMYMIFGTERYAYRACVAYGIMRENGSENDIISGPELVEVMAKVSERKGDR